MPDSDQTALTPDALQHRDGLPSEFRYLEQAYPRSGWPTLDMHPSAEHWLQIHDWFRGQVQDLTGLGSQWREGKIGASQYRGAATPRLRQFLNNLHHHHTIESTYAFPALIAAEPAMTGGFALLDRDHDAIEHLMAAMVEAANALIRAGNGPDDLTPLADALAGAIDGGTMLIGRHLWDEEEIIVPVFSLRGDAVKM